MPAITYKARGFNARPPTAPVPVHHKPVEGVDWDDSISVSREDVIAAGIAVGDPGIFRGQPNRSALQCIWRATTIATFLEETPDGFVLADEHTYLDSSEQVHISYHLGMAQCDLLARQALSARVTVHSDRVLELLYDKIPNQSSPSRKRPDLLGYSYIPNQPQAFARLLLEAKGTHNGGISKMRKDALEQLNTPVIELQNLIGNSGIRVASVAHFPANSRGGRRLWSGYLADPPPPEQREPSGIFAMDDQDFAGILTLAQLLPIYQAIEEVREEQPSRVHHALGGQLEIASLPFTQVSIGMPTRFTEIFRSMSTPLSGRRDRREATGAAAQYSQTDAARAMAAELSQQTRKAAALPSGVLIIRELQV